VTRKLSVSLMRFRATKKQDRRDLEVIQTEERGSDGRQMLSDTGRIVSRENGNVK
jgi:hypothetical protein